MVLSGVSTAADLIAAAKDQRPRYVAADLAGVHQPAEDVEIGARRSWQARVGDGAVEVRGDDGASPLDLLRAVCAAWWAVGEGPVKVRALDDAARSALAELRLA